MGYAEVAVDTPTGNRTFSYHFSPSLPVQSGQAVLVPFGSRYIAGIVFDVAEHPQVERTREIVDLLHPEILLHPHQLAFARWISQTYLASLYESATLLLPPGILGRRVANLSPTQKGLRVDIEQIPESQQAILGYLRQHLQTSPSVLRRSFGPRLQQQLSLMEKAGLIERRWTWRRPSNKGRFVSLLRMASGVSNQTVASLAKGRAKQQVALIRTLFMAGPSIQAVEARRRFGPTAVTGLLKKGLLIEELVPIQSAPIVEERFAKEEPLKLTGHQERALARLSLAIESANVGPRSFLLHGVTGSGKTEVYLQALAKVVERNQQGIILVPEISLSAQMMERFNRRFPGRVALLHSELTQAQRRDTWWRLYRGEFDVVVGSRSALFAPLPNIGLIVLDEEHEWTYKQADSAPSYHARESAIELARLTGSIAVLGSATPDVVTYYRTQHGQHQGLLLPDRIRPPTVSRNLADVRIVDMRAELKKGNRSMFSDVLKDAVKTTLGQGGQVILFLNRRGSSTHVQCRQCGYSVGCRSCSIPLTYHVDRGRLLCHHCGRVEQAPYACPMCKSHRIRYLGVGTQRVVQEVQELFPQAETVRWDRDVSTISGQRDLVLDKFIRGDAQILVGTQMVTKGLHIPNVMLVGVILADLGLYIPDFRAQERVFQLLCQVAGRAGRGAMAGEAIIQTYQPANYAVQAAAAQSYERFYNEEISFRRLLRYPPFSRLARLTYSHRNPLVSEREANRMRQLLLRHQRAIGDGEIAVIGPAPAYPARVRGRYRWNVVLRSPNPAGFLRPIKLPSGWAVDIDPVTVA